MWQQGVSFNAVQPGTSRTELKSRIKRFTFDIVVVVEEMFPRQPLFSTLHALTQTTSQQRQLAECEFVCDIILLYETLYHLRLVIISK